MHKRGLELYVNRLFSSELSNTLKFMIRKNSFTLMKLKIGSSCLDNYSFDFRYF